MIVFNCLFGLPNLMICRKLNILFNYFYSIAIFGVDEYLLYNSLYKSSCFRYSLTFESLTTLSAVASNRFDSQMSYH